MGISSSKTPGVAGIYPKSTVQLITEVRTLNALYQQLERLPKKWRHKLEYDRDLAFLYRRVVTLDIAVTLQGNLQQLRLRWPLHEKCRRGAALG